MNRSLIAALPFLAAAALYAFFATSDPSVETYRMTGLLARGLAAAGCFIGAMRFDRGDYMRRAWGFLGLAYAVYFTNALVFGAASHSATRDISSAAAIASGTLVLLGNASTIVGALMVGRAWRAAGLDLMVNPTTRRLVTAGTVVLAVAVAGPAAASNLVALVGGHLDGLSHLASAVGDMVTLAVLGSVLLTALALRGGSLAWPWSLIVIGTLGWLVYDARVTLVWMLGPEAFQVRAFEETARMFACAAFLSAGLLQAMVLRQEAPAPAVDLAAP